MWTRQYQGLGEPSDISQVVKSQTKQIMFFQRTLSLRIFLPTRLARDRSLAVATSTRQFTIVSHSLCSTCKAITNNTDLVLLNGFRYKRECLAHRIQLHPTDAALTKWHKSSSSNLWLKSRPWARKWAQVLKNRRLSSYGINTTTQLRIMRKAPDSLKIPNHHRLLSGQGRAKQVKSWPWTH